MKTKLYTLIAVFFMSLGVNAQIDRSQQPKPAQLQRFHWKSHKNLN